MRSILIVEDDKDIRENLQEALENEGLNVLTADNGLTALNLLKSKSDEQFPSLIILDLMMPKMDGITFLKTIQKEGSPSLKQIPVVLATAARDRTASGFDQVKGTLRKPLDLDALLKAVQTHSL